METLATSRRERLHLWALFLAACSAYGLYAVAKHAGFMSSYDLAIFDQHLWRASHGFPLANTVRELPHLWGDHFHPLFLVLTPLYWIGDGTTNLLWAQAALVTAGVFPLYRYARRRIDHIPALLLVASFLVAWPVGEGLGFDVHEIALTVPALGWAILLFEERRFTPFWVAVAAMLLTREDQGFTVAMFGVLALTRRDFRLGMGLVVIGAGWSFAAVRWIVPHFSGVGYAQWMYGHLAADAPSLVVLFLTRPWVLVKSLVLPLKKVALVRRFLEPTLYIGLASPLTLLAVPGVAARLLSKYPKHWEPNLHWGLVTAMVLAFATTDVFGRALPLVRRVHRTRVARGAAGLLLAASLVGASLVPQKSLFRPSFWQDEPRRAAGREALALIPPDASVVATVIALPHLTHRLHAYVDWGYYRVYPPTWKPDVEPSAAAKFDSYSRADWIVFDPFVPNPEGLAIVAGRTDFVRVYDREGWTLFRRR